MNKIRFLSTIFVLLCSTAGLLAQNVNRLSVQNIKGIKGTTVTLAVNLDNTSTDIVGMQWNLNLPAGMALDPQSATLNATRKVDHLVAVEEQGDGRCTFLVYSPGGNAIRGNSGTVVTVKVSLAEWLEEDRQYPVTLTGVVLTNGAGENLATGSADGSITITHTPDFMPSDLKSLTPEVSPEGTIRLQWKVTNVGEVASAGAWSERVTLFSSNGEEAFLTTLYPAESYLEAGQSVQREEEIVLPQIVGIDGPVAVKVEVVPNEDAGESSSLRYNNMARTDEEQALFVNKKLFLVMPASVDEDNAGSIRCQLIRSGSRKEAMDFSVSIDGDQRLSGPGIVTIDAGASAAFFDLTLADNEALDEDSLFAVSISGNDYVEIKNTLTVVDDELPSLTVRASKTEVNEGESFSVTVSTEKVQTTPLVIMLSSEDNTWLQVPSTVTIEPGTSSVTTSVQVTDNDVIDNVATIAISAWTEGYERGECLVLVNDNDMPTLTFTLTPNAVSESAGATAALGVIRRTDNLDKKVTLKLSDDADGQLAYLSQTVVMAKGVEEVKFGIDVVDNDFVDGDKTFTVTATVYASSCNCPAQGAGQSVLTSKIIVLDDDGPALSLSGNTAILAEGTTDNVMVVNRNTTGTAAQRMTATLSSDCDDRLTYNHTVVFEENETEKEVLIDVPKNNVEGDDRLVTFKVEADGYAASTKWLYITDKTLPDVVIKGVTVEDSVLEVGMPAALAITIANEGVSTLRAGTMVTVRVDDKYLDAFNTSRDVEPGGTAELLFSARMPEKPGVYTLEIEANSDKTVNELIYVNNTSQPLTVTVLPVFTASITTDKSYYRQGETVVFSGQTSGNGGKNCNVEIFVNDGEQTISLDAMTDEEGRFTKEWQLPLYTAGHIAVGACYPGLKPQVPSIYIDVVGLKTQPNFSTCDVKLDENHEGSIQLTNISAQKLTNIRVNVLGQSQTASFSFNRIASIEPGQKALLPFTVHGDAVSNGHEWEKMKISITSDEGADVPYTVYYYVQPQRAYLKANPSYIATTVRMGETRDYPVTVTNYGKEETGEITLSLPYWIYTSSPVQVASLQPGDSTTIMIHFNSFGEMQLNKPVTGHFGINCANGSGTTVGFTITPVSDQTGKLIVDVVDEFTFFTEEAPHVENATVKVTKPSSNEVVAEGKTGPDGHYTGELPEGWYNISVEAENHIAYNGQVMVDAGWEKHEEVFITYDNVSYDWNVVETGVDDQYEIETVATYEVMVPKPVIEMTMPDLQPDPYTVIPITVTNKGWINVVDCRASLEYSGSGVRVEWLTDPELDTLKAKQTVTFYARLLPNGNQLNATKDATVKCIKGKAYFSYHLICDKYTGKYVVVKERRWGPPTCVTTGEPGGQGGDDVYDPGYPPVWGDTQYDNDYHITIETLTIPCDAEDVEKVPCDKEPVFAFNLVKSEKEKRPVKGLAADGASRVLILLDRKLSKIPTDECEYNYLWTLSEDFGDLINESSLDKVTYLAPKDFPKNEKDKEKTIYAVLKYWRNGESAREVRVPIRIIRTPVVILHGLNDNYMCWWNIKHFLCDEEGLYHGFQVKLADYSSTNCASFLTNMHVVQERIDSVKWKCLNNGFVIEKADLVGHSMGGLLSRLHVQYVNNQDVHKVITANTPHSGSPLGDVFDRTPQMQLVAPIFGFESPAILDLAENSYATDQLLNNKYLLSRMEGIPVHAITTNVENRDLMKTESRLVWLASSAINIPPLKWLFDIGKALNLPYFLDVAFDMEDLIVPLSSQQGGLTGNAVWHMDGNLNEAFHCFAPKNEEIWKHVRDMLLLPTESSFFSQHGFVPVDLTYPSHTKAPQAAGDGDMADYHVNVTAALEGDSIVVGITSDLESGNYAAMAKLTLNMIVESGKQCRFFVPEEYQGTVTVYGFVSDEEGNIGIDSTFVDIPAAKAHPVSVQVIHDIFLLPGGKQPVQLECTWSNGALTLVTPESVEFDNDIALFDGRNIIAKEGGFTSATFHFKDLVCTAIVEIYMDYEIEEEEDDEEDSGSICSKVVLSFKQESVMTRQAFDGTLTIMNGHKENDLKDLIVSLQVKDENGKVATEHEFYIGLNDLQGMEGEKTLNAPWTLPAGGKGVADFLFIPTKYAAPTVPVKYSFGGSFSYVDPSTGLRVSHELNPVTLTVNPSPNLEFTYFLQRDVLGDDPMTEDVQEECELAEFALLINNKGYGDAENLSIITHQPKIIENKKGLYIDFQLVSTQLNGGEATLSLGGDMTSDFGTIPAHGQAYAQWWLRSSLMGHFIKYNVTANHVTSRNNPDLSLLDTVSVHELIRSVRVTGTEKLAYIVNDIPDKKDQADMAYLTDGSVAEVQEASYVSITRVSDTEYKLFVAAPDKGWVYGNVADPTAGKMQLTGIMRNSDGVEISLRNIWQTYVTLRDGKDPFYENMIHVADLLENSYESYTLYFEPVAETELRVTSFTGIPESGETEDKVKDVTVSFSKGVDVTTFTPDDLTLTHDGVRLDNRLIGISAVSDEAYVLDLSKLTPSHGFYVLTVSTKDITDIDGFKGVTNSSVAWLQYDPDKVYEMQAAHWQVAVAEGTVIITSDTDLTLPILTLDGRLCRMLHVAKGVSYHRGLAPGVYILGDKKLVISQ